MPGVRSSLDLGSNKITSLANGTASSDAAAFGQIPVLDATAADIQPAGAQGAGSSTKAPAADHVHPATFWVPSDNGLLIANGDPITFQATLIATAGTVYLQKIVARQQVLITNLWYNISAAGNNTGGSTGTFVGLYSSSGTLLSGSSDVAASLATQAPASLALTTPQTVSAGTFVWAAILCNLGTTQPTFFRGLGGAITSGNGGLTASTYRWAVNGTGRTTLPSPITPSSNAGTTMTAWVGGS